MPQAFLTPCRRCRAAGRWAAGYCPTCQPVVRRAVEAARPALHQRGWYHTPRWTRARLAFLRTAPLCAQCRRPANTVDHIVPHRMDEGLFWDEANWQALCASCHSRKTAREDGGFGRRTP